MAFWETVIEPALGRRGMSPTNLRLLCRGRRVTLGQDVTLADAGITPLSTVEVSGWLPSQGFSRLHQLMEHLLEMLAPIEPPAATPPADDAASSSREPIMHAIDAELKRLSARQEAGGCCACLSCTQRPNSTLWLCGYLLHSTDAAVVNLTFRVVQLLLHARTDCPAPIVFFNEDAGALTLGAREAEFGWVFDLVQDALTPEGVAIASLLCQRLTYDGKTHPLLWQHTSKKQTLLEMAARSSHPGLLRSLLPALGASRLAGSGARSAGSRLAPLHLHPHLPLLLSSLFSLGSTPFGPAREGREAWGGEASPSELHLSSSCAHLASSAEPLSLAIPALAQCPWLATRR
jgi:hypothetical protein